MSQLKRIKVEGSDATYHAMSRVVGGQRLFGDREKGRKYPLKPKLLRGADWQGLAIIQGLRKQVFG